MYVQTLLGIVCRGGGGEVRLSPILPKGEGGEAKPSKGHSPIFFGFNYLIFLKYMPPKY